MHKLYTGGYIHAECSAEHIEDGQKGGESRSAVREGATAHGKPAVLANGRGAPDAVRRASSGRPRKSLDDVAQRGADEAVRAPAGDHLAHELGHARVRVEQPQRAEDDVVELAAQTCADVAAMTAAVVVVEMVAVVMEVPPGSCLQAAIKRKGGLVG